jgi:hypothetical protein
MGCRCSLRCARALREADVEEIAVGKGKRGDKAEPG